ANQCKHGARQDPLDQIRKGVTALAPSPSPEVCCGPVPGLENSEPNFRKGSIPTSEAIAGSAESSLPLTFEELTMDEAVVRAHPEPWNKGKLVGQKAPFKLKEIWAIRVRLQLFRRTRDLALFDLGIDSKLRACDLVRLKVRDIFHGDRVAARAVVMQQKTSRPVQFEITESTREAVARLDQ